MKYKINSQEEYLKMMECVQLYHKQMLANQSNLAGTYWRKTTTIEAFDNQPERILFEYIFITNNDGKTSKFRITKYAEDNIYITSSTSSFYADLVAYHNEKLECISAEQFKSETRPLLEYYNLKWIEK